MLVPALCGCDSVPERLAVGGLRVHSVFRRACNVLNNRQQMVTLQAADTPLAPGGLLLACSDLTRLFSVDMPLMTADQALVQVTREGRITVSLAECDWRSSRLTAGGTGADTLAAAITAFLPVRPPQNGFWQRWQADDTVIGDTLPSLADWLRRPQGLPVSQVGQLTGYGAGLTPSGDDFLLGLLLVLDRWHYPQRPMLVQAVRQQLSRTTDISAAMLDYGCAGHYSAWLLALFTTPAANLANAVARLADYGHSSGHDMLCGMQFALSVGVI